jgi:hypothetical protein
MQNFTPLDTKGNPGSTPPNKSKFSFSRKAVFALVGSFVAIVAVIGGVFVVQNSNNSQTAEAATDGLEFKVIACETVGTTQSFASFIKNITVTFDTGEKAEWNNPAWGVGNLSEATLGPVKLSPGVHTYTWTDTTGVGTYQHPGSKSITVPPCASTPTPTLAPTASPKPTNIPTTAPSKTPTPSPTKSPTPTPLPTDDFTLSHDCKEGSQIVSARVINSALNSHDEKIVMTVGSNVVGTIVAPANGNLVSTTINVTPGSTVKAIGNDSEAAGGHAITFIAKNCAMPTNTPTATPTICPVPGKVINAKITCPTCEGR